MDGGHWPMYLPNPRCQLAMLTAAFRLMHSNADYVHVEATIIPSQEGAYWTKCQEIVSACSRSLQSLLAGPIASYGALDSWVIG